MINLLPPEDKRQISAGQANVLLLRYCISSLLLTIPIALLVAGIYFVLLGSKSTSETTIAESEAKSANFAKTTAEAQEFNQNLTIAKTILGKEVRYSKIVVAIAQVIPPGVYLQSLDLNSEAFGQPVVLTAMGKSYDHAIKLKNSLEQATNLFSDVHLQSINAQDADGNEYPISISISLVINKEVSKL